MFEGALIQRQFALAIDMILMPSIVDWQGVLPWAEFMIGGSPALPPTSRPPRMEDGLTAGIMVP